MELRDRLLEEIEFRRLSDLYARAMDRRDQASLAELFTDDAVIEAPLESFIGKRKILEIPTMLTSKYEVTRHVTHNFVLNHHYGQIAHGETYSSACHIARMDTGGREMLVMHIRYQDDYRNEQGRWKFFRRKLVLDCVETRPIKLGKF